MTFHPDQLMNIIPAHVAVREIPVQCDNDPERSLHLKGEERSRIWMLHIIKVLVTERFPNDTWLKKGSSFL